MKPKHVKYTPSSINSLIPTVRFGPVLDSDHTPCIPLLWTIRYNFEDRSSYLRQSEIYSVDNLHSVFVLVKVASETEYLPYQLFLFTHHQSSGSALHNYVLNIAEPIQIWNS